MAKFKDEILEAPRYSPTDQQTKNYRKRVKNLKPNTNYNNVIDGRRENFKTALALLMLIRARDAVFKQERAHKTALDALEGDIEKLTSDITVEENKPIPDPSRIEKLKEDRVKIRKSRESLLLGGDDGVWVTLRMKFSNSLIHPDGEIIDPHLDDFPLFGISPSAVADESGDSNMIEELIEGFGNYTYALYCGD